MVCNTIVWSKNSAEPDVAGTERYQGTNIQIGSATYGSAALPTSTLVSTGTLISTTGSIYNAQGQVAESTNAAGLRTGTVYYPDGTVQYTGPLKSTAPVGGPYTTADFASYTTYLYNQVDSSGQLYDRVIDANGHHTDTYKDLLGRVTKTVFDDGSFTETLYGVSSQPIPGFDLTPTIPQGGSEKIEITQTDANNHTTAFTFDQNANELSRTLPDSEQETFTYNSFNQVATHIDFNGNVATYSYLPASDPHAGSLYQVVYSGAPGSGKATQTVTYLLDDMGRQHVITDASGTTSNFYDPQGNLIEQDTPEGIIHHAFDAATGLLIETWTAYTDIAYGHNSLGELTTTTVKELNGQALATPLVTTDGYDAVGNKISETLPNGIVTSWTDDDLNRLVAMTQLQGSTTVYSETFTLNEWEKTLI